MSQSVNLYKEWSVRPFDPVPSFHPAETDSKWTSVIELAKSCTGKITINGHHLGCGILIGIDRVIVPSHVISNINPSSLLISFLVENSIVQCCFPYEFNVLQAYSISETFAILQLSRDGANHYPGNKIPFPTISEELHHGEFLFSTHSGDGPSTAVSKGSSCREIGSAVQFCSRTSTVEGDCGGGYFDSNGRLFGIHISRSSGMCTLQKETRQAIYFNSIVNKSFLAQRIFNASVCAPLCPPQRPPLPIASSPYSSPCFIEEGARKRAEEKFMHKGIAYYIQHDGHGDKHVLPHQSNLTNKEKNQLIRNTQTGSAMFYPDRIHHNNYDQYVSLCVRKWIEKGADQTNTHLEFESPIGADNGRETKWVQIYLSGGKIGAHIRPIEK